MREQLKSKNKDTFFNKTKPFLFIGLTSISILMSIHTKFVISANSKKVKNIMHKTNNLHI